MRLRRPDLRIILVSAAVLALPGCGGDDGGGPVDGIPVSSLTGTWTITLGDSLPCTDTLANPDLEVLVGGTEDDVLPAGSLTFAENWSNPGGQSGTAYGTINVVLRSVVLHLVRQDTLAYGLEIRGTLDDNLALRGVANDPYPGYEPLLVTAPCTFTVQGTRTSP